MTQDQLGRVRSDLDALKAALAEQLETADQPQPSAPVDPTVQSTAGPEPMAVSPASRPRAPTPAVLPSWTSTPLSSLVPHIRLT